MHPPLPSLLFLLRMRNGKLFCTQVRQIGLVPLDTILLYRRIKYVLLLLGNLLSTAKSLVVGAKSRSGPTVTGLNPINQTNTICIKRNMLFLGMLKEYPPPEKSLTTLSQYVVVKMTNDLQKINIKKKQYVHVRSLFNKERRERFAHGCSFLKSDESKSLTVAL